MNLIRLLNMLVAPVDETHSNFTWQEQKLDSPTKKHYKIMESTMDTYSEKRHKVIAAETQSNIPKYCHNMYSLSIKSRALIQQFLAFCFYSISNSGDGQGKTLTSSPECDKPQLFNH